MSDITERKRAEDHIQFLMREMTHRSKNLLSVVQSIARQTSRTTDSLEDFDTRFGQRLQGLAASHDVLVDEGWRGAPLAGLVRQQLQPFVTEVENTRVRFSGPEVVVTAQAAQAIGLALHELATNSLKYGALSTADGHLEISWAFENGGEAPRQLTLRWGERGGPPVKIPSRKGFGHMVIESMIARSLDGNVSLEFAPEGLDWAVTMPASNLVGEPGGAA
jgi:two-component sensor histidine kinase